MNRKERRAAASARRAELSNEVRDLPPVGAAGICAVCGQPCTSQFGGRLEGRNVPYGCEKCQPDWVKIWAELM